ncbi:2OG-Fe(II) oxygenase [Microbulbifer thermotolerans]|uniref:2OG-Fe(II) oxygenase n=1 Tax=Microbulbifer thermotolerans TaxID=252514 RepID=UPI0008F2AED4|nr:2OG-Fe(II) oxygenase [Microbulbifer thermotolerans]MCX2779644.1 2OG-Fe(II) oxygenase [Microbulbifer thermotolerans]MCX2782610.1 2OG-Fe(II) oxygenase [Microbulbifer thermotolerans]MCX2794622.1 2OG-Fe(II) oxygenase [Microbulbifer thermotolerans]MCX2804925.1 2OG-Fe(II) oxygenase [Microbulbifer thermotolerans]MCX2841906.1 2OG-Fe(II) oxygenase [Microbulbifer thermotolerans]
MTTIATERSSWLQPTTLTNGNTLVRSAPFPFFVGRDVLSRDLLPKLLEDFPRLRGAGYLPYEKAHCGDAINKLIEQLVAPDFADTIGDNLGIDKLSQYPTYVSISRFLKKRHGNIHTDGKSKIATALLYLNPEWTVDGNGCLRFLNRIDDYDDMVVPEIKPTYGTLVAFKRTENSFHGHLPFEGERLVIQVAWLASEADKARKARDGRLSYKLKRIQGWLSRIFGREKQAGQP